MNKSMTPSPVELIQSGNAILGIELGSTRIKASLIDPDGALLASGTQEWENQLEHGVWTYSVAQVKQGLAGCFASLAADVESRFSLELTRVAAIGVSAMMHGYIALSREGELLVPFRTWRNNITGDASAELTKALDFALPQRWSVAHLYQSILESQSHVADIARLTTLAGYVHWRLTGEHKVGVGEASGMFPVDQETDDWDKAREAQFNALVAQRNVKWKLGEILPEVVPAGKVAGTLTADGAKLLDPSGRLQPGVSLCAPEGDAGTGMVATNAVRPRSGNVSAGTSVFAMIVLEKSLSRVHEEIDIVATPDGKPVAMVHSNNGSSDLDAWLALFRQVGSALGANTSPDQLYEAILPLALKGDPDAGGLLSINYVSGEHITGFSEGRPLFVRNQGDNFSLENFVRAMYFSSLCALRKGMDILIGTEDVVVDQIRGHGGFFKGGETGQRMMAAALNVPVSIPTTAGEGGSWGMALLAGFMLRKDQEQSLPDFLDARIASAIGRPVLPLPRDVEGFAEFYQRHRRGLAIEREAIKALR